MTPQNDQNDAGRPRVAVTCRGCQMFSVYVPVEQDFLSLPTGSQFTALTPEAAKHGFSVIRDSSGGRHFFCPACTKGRTFPPPPEYDPSPCCCKCLADEPSMRYCAGCPRCPGGHIHHFCKKCRYEWVTLAGDSPTTSLPEKTG